MRIERTRKERKARYIRAKNLMRQHPECSYGGDFYCNHVYDPDHPWVWVDFRFFHTRLKRYYAVAMITLEYEAWDMAETQVLEEVWSNDTLDHKSLIERQRLVKEKMEERLVPVTLRPSIYLRDYGPVVIGVHATVNKPYIDEHVIREFIAFFRSLGEPVTPGWFWRGEETQVDARHYLQTP